MSRLRRLNGGSGCVPVAAEVLEMRAMLSAGAAAARTAAHHAAIQIQPIDPLTSHATVVAAVSINGGTPGSLPPIGKFSLSNFSLTDGSKVTAKVSFNLGGPDSFTASFAGTIHGFSVVGSDTFITLDPTGGDMILKAAVGRQRFAAKAVPDGSEWHLVLRNGSFHLLSETDAFVPTAPMGYATEPIYMLIGF